MWQPNQLSEQSSQLRAYRDALAKIWNQTPCVFGIHIAKDLIHISVAKEVLEMYVTPHSFAHSVYEQQGIQIPVELIRVVRSRR